MSNGPSLAELKCSMCRRKVQTSSKRVSKEENTFLRATPAFIISSFTMCGLIGVKLLNVESNKGIVAIFDNLTNTVPY